MWLTDIWVEIERIFQSAVPGNVPEKEQRLPSVFTLEKQGISCSSIGKISGLMDRKMFVWRAADGSIDVSSGVWHFSAKRKKINRFGCQFPVMSAVSVNTVVGKRQSKGHTFKFWAHSKGQAVTFRKWLFGYQGQVKWFSIFGPIHAEQRRLSRRRAGDHTIHTRGEERLLGHRESPGWVWTQNGEIKLFTLQLLPRLGWTLLFQYRGKTHVAVQRNLALIHFENTVVLLQSIFYEVMFCYKCCSLYLQLTGCVWRVIRVYRQQWNVEKMLLKNVKEGS